MTRCPRTLLVSHFLHSTENQRLKRSYWKNSNEQTFNGLNSKQGVTKVVSKLGHYWHYSLDNDQSRIAVGLSGSYEGLPQIILISLKKLDTL